MAPPTKQRWTDEVMRELFTDRLAARAWQVPGGLSSLSTKTSRPDLDRPQLPLLVRLLQDGFRGLDEYSLSELTAAQNSGSVPWGPRFPFDGPTPGEWETVDHWPSSRKSPWRLQDGGGIVPPQIDWSPPSLGGPVEIELPSERFDDLADASGACWIRLPPNVFVLVQGMRARQLVLGQLYPTVGFDPADVSLVGLAWIAMREAVGQFDRWFDGLRTHRWSGVYGYPAFSIAHGDIDVLRVLAELTSGARGERVHLFENQALGKGVASSRAQFASIDIRPGRTTDTPGSNRLPNARFAEFVDAAIRWYIEVRTRGAAVPIAAEVFRLAADDIAGLAGLLAHEALHTAWRRAADEEIGLPHELEWHDNATDETVGPPVTRGNVLRAFEFDTRRDVVTEPNPPPGSTAATRHYAVYVFGHLVEGLLTHDVPSSLDHLIENFCNKNPLSDYEIANSTDCSPYP